MNRVRLERGKGCIRLMRVLHRCCLQLWIWDREHNDHRLWKKERLENSPVVDIDSLLSGGLGMKGLTLPLTIELLLDWGRSSGFGRGAKWQWGLGGEGVDLFKSLVKTASKAGLKWLGIVDVGEWEVTGDPNAGGGEFGVPSWEVEEKPESEAEVGEETLNKSLGGGDWVRWGSFKVLVELLSCLFKRIPGVGGGLFGDWWPDDKLELTPAIGVDPAWCWKK